MRIALVGAGSLGTIIGALLTQGGEDIVLVDVHEEHVKAMNDKGARITGRTELTVPVRAITPDQMDGIYGLIIYLVKTVYDDQALGGVLHHIDENSSVITLQNGVPEDKVASVVGRERTLGGAVGWGATWLGPGISELTSPSDSMTYDIGELDGAITPRLHAIREVLSKSGEVTITSNLLGVRWTKLMVNVTMSGMSAALGCTFGEVLDNDKATLAAISIALETLKTAKALGITLEPMSGADPNLIVDVVRQSEENAVSLWRMVFEPSRDLKASMLQDLEKGRPCEVETLNGYLSRKSAEAGVATPVNDKVTEIIRGIEAGRYPLSFDNLDMIEVRPLQEII